MTRFVPFCALTICIVARSFAQTPATRASMNNPVGWKWVVTPLSIPLNWEKEPLKGKTVDGEYEIARTDTGTTKITLRRSGPVPRSGVEFDFRGVVYDLTGARFAFEAETTAGDTKKSVYTFVLSAVKVPAASIRFVGIEMMDPEGRRKLSIDAQRRAREAKLAVLPTPEIGKRYEFSLKTYEDKPIRSADLRGHVIMIDAWSTDCADCMRKMKGLVKFYELHHNRLFEIVGINFDEKKDRIDPLSRELEMRWPQVHVPADESTREIWKAASTFTTLPRMLLIDRHGILRADCTPLDLDQKLNELLAEPIEDDLRSGKP